MIPPMLECSVVPNIAASVGSIGTKHLLQSINNEWGSGEVLFGSDIDPLGTRYQTYLKDIIAVANDDGIAIQMTQAICSDTANMRPIVCEDDLRNVPVSMYVPILTMPVMRDLLEEGVITGFGVDPVDLPEEDVTGRLLHNGTIDGIQDHEELIFEWEWKTTDPNYSDEDLDALELTRAFFADLIRREQRKGANGIDPTDPYGGSLGNIQ